jgi:hypothetical protein
VTFDRSGVTAAETIAIACLRVSRHPGRSITGRGRIRYRPALSVPQTPIRLILTYGFEEHA